MESRQQLFLWWRFYVVYLVIRKKYVGQPTNRKWQQIENDGKSIYRRQMRQIYEKHVYGICANFSFFFHFASVMVHDLWVCMCVSSFSVFLEERTVCQNSSDWLCSQVHQNQNNFLLSIFEHTEIEFYGFGECFIFRSIWTWFENCVYFIDFRLLSVSFVSYSRFNYTDNGLVMLFHQQLAD